MERITVSSYFPGNFAVKSSKKLEVDLMKIRVATLTFVLMSISAIPTLAATPAKQPQKLVQTWKQKMASYKPLWQKMKRHDTNGQYHFPESPSSASMLITFPQNTSANNFQ